MHEKIKSTLDKSLADIESWLDIKFGSISQEKYKLVLTELAKVKHDKSETKGYQYLQDIVLNLQAMTGYGDDEYDFMASIGRVGSLLNETSKVYRDIIRSESVEDKDFTHIQSEEVYAEIAGLLGDS